MTTDTSTLDFGVLATAQIPAAWFAKYAGFSRITVALWLAAYRSGEVRRLRYPFYLRAKAVLTQIEQGLQAGDFPIKKLTYAEFTSAMDKYQAA